jgi:hypothetical protein
MLQHSPPVPPHSSSSSHVRLAHVRKHTKGEYQALFSLQQNDAFGCVQFNRERHLVAASSFGINTTKTIAELTNKKRYIFLCSVPVNFLYRPVLIALA